jgi:hypothetical protein
MRRLAKGLIAGTLLAAAGITIHGSSHREALAILNEPCADNTDTFAWVSPGAHDKLYLIMDFNPLHEPGQGNQGLRACDGYRYEFHIGRATSLRTKWSTASSSPNGSSRSGSESDDNLGGGNELLWQLTGGTETMEVSRVGFRGDDEAAVVLGGISLSSRTITARRPTAHLRSRPFAGYQSGMPPAVKWASTIRRSSTRTSTAVERRPDHRRPVRRPVSAR